LTIVSNDSVRIEGGISEDLPIFVV
jgi:hypothetical protein